MTYTINEYMADARRTMVLDDNTGFHKMVAGLGLAGEAGELAFLAFKGEYANHDEVQKEAGDTLWYVAFLCHLYDLDLCEITGAETFAEYQQSVLRQSNLFVTPVDIALRLNGYAGFVADLIKKEVGHGHPAEPSRIYGSLCYVMDYLCRFARFYELDMATIAQANIAKLKARYPDGFSTEASVKRADLGAET